MPSEELTKEIEAAADQVVAEANAQFTAENQESEEVIDQDETKIEESDITEDGDTTSDDSETESEIGEDESSSATIKEQKDDDDDDDFLVPDLSDEVITRAIQAGMTLTDVLAFQDEAELRRVLASSEMNRQDTKQETEEKDPFAEFELDPEKHEPEIVELFGKVKGVLEVQHKQIQGFRQQQEEVAQASKVAVAREVTQWFDKSIEGLGEEFTDTLGTGTYDSLERGSPQLANRDKIAKQTSVLLAGYRATGQEPPPRDEVFNMAARLVMVDKFQELHEKQLAKGLQKREKQHIQRVGGTKAKKTQSPEEETAALVDAKFS